MTEVVHLVEHRPMTPLFSVQVWRRADGKVCASIIDADACFLDALPSETPRERSVACAYMLASAFWLHPEND